VAARSRSQIAAAPEARRQTIEAVYSGHDFDFHKLSGGAGGYLAFARANLF